MLLVFAEFSVSTEPEVYGSSIELRMTTGALRMTGWVVEDGGLGVEKLLVLKLLLQRYFSVLSLALAVCSQEYHR